MYPTFEPLAPEEARQGHTANDGFVTVDPSLQIRIAAVVAFLAIADDGRLLHIRRNVGRHDGVRILLCSGPRAPLTGNTWMYPTPATPVTPATAVVVEGALGSAFAMMPLHSFRRSCLLILRSSRVSHTKYDIGVVVVATETIRVAAHLVFKRVLVVRGGILVLGLRNVGSRQANVQNFAGGGEGVAAGVLFGTSEAGELEKRS
ncbi:hypothetical protein IMZ48_00935 [Candidatus Bathyarchaeota archaeon]|nr:hypothetical protein [Candidatus Bathyarchaeota archaeon]